MIRVLRIIAAIFVAFCNYGILQAYGSLFTATLETFGESRAKTSLIHSVLFGAAFGSGVVAGYLIKRWNIMVVSTIGSILLPGGFIVSYFATSVTYLIISVGIAVGVGISFTFVCAVAVIGTVTPDKHKTTALALQNVACGLPGIMLQYFYRWLTVNFSLFGTFLIYGGITLNNLAVVILFSGVKQKSQNENDKKSGLNQGGVGIVGNSNPETDNGIRDVTDERTDRICDHDKEDGGKVSVSSELNVDADSILLSRSGRKFIFIIFVIAETLVMGSVGGFQTIFQDIGDIKGLSTDEILFCLAAFNVCGTISRFLPIIIQIVTGNPFVTPIIACLFGAAGQIIIRVTSHYYWLVIGYGFTGVTGGGGSTAAPVIIFTILTPESQVLGFGLVLTLIGIVATGSGPLYGAIFDATQSYDIVLYLTTSIFTLGSVLFVVCFASYKSFTSGCCRKRTEQKRIISTGAENKGYETH